jgi:hypothetical protein
MVAFVFRVFHEYELLCSIAIDYMGNLTVGRSGRGANAEALIRVPRRVNVSDTIYTILYSIANG